MNKLQLDFLQQLADGYTATEAAKVLGKNIRTMEKVLADLKKEYGAFTSTHLVVILVRKGEIK